jgi:hypothetical protein
MEEVRTGYFRFLLGGKQLVDWLVIVLTVVVGCLLVTWSYPYPEMISDSFSYLHIAKGNVFSALRPFGYCAYLRFLHYFSRDTSSIVVSQALLYILSSGLLLLAVKKYWPPRNPWAFRLFEVVVAGSPAALFMLNAVMSDAIFCCLVFTLLAMLIVVIEEGSWPAMVLYAAALFASLHTRYSAMFFPVAFIPVLLLMKGRTALKIVSVALTVLACCVFYWQICHNMEHDSGKRQFSTGFDGWQLSNNAMHVLPHLSVDQRLDQVPEDYELYKLHMSCLDSTEWILRLTDGGKRVTASFMWGDQSPLKQKLFREMYVRQDNWYDVWMILGTGLYRDYGKWVIRSFPGKFIRWYLLPNTRSVFFDPRSSEIIGSYENVPPGKKEVVQWFDVPETQELTARNDYYERWVVPVLPWIEALTWLAFLASLIYLLRHRLLQSLPRTSWLVLLLLFLFGLIYYGTTTFASPISLRYWMPMHAVKLIFAWICCRLTQASVS